MKKFDYSKLKSLREEKGITQKEMSNRLNMTQANYSKLENGQKKIDSLQTIENIAKALEMPRGRLIGIMTNQENIQSSGIEVSELLRVEEILKKKSLREDEFILFSAEVLDLEKHEFKDKYSGLNLKDFDDDDIIPIWDYPPVMNIICADSVEIGFSYQKKKLKEVNIWLADKKLGILPERFNALVDELISLLMISRVVLIENDNGVPGYFDTYMKAVFISTNAVCKSAEFSKGRFSTLKFLSKEQVANIDDEVLPGKEKKRRRIK